jgi:hypothetical protein
MGTNYFLRTASAQNRQNKGKASEGQAAKLLKAHDEQVLRNPNS